MGSKSKGSEVNTILQAVAISIAAGQHDAYRSSANGFSTFRAAHEVRRNGRPRHPRGEAGSTDVGPRLTLYEDLDEIEGKFRALYSEGKGKALSERRPALVAQTIVALYNSHPPG